MTRANRRQMGADAQQRGVIHLGRTVASLVLNVATAAILKGGMERGRLLVEIGSGGGVAANASGRFDATYRRVACVAPVTQKSMLGG